MSTHNICFCQEIRQILYVYFLLSGGTCVCVLNDDAGSQIQMLFTMFTSKVQHIFIGAPYFKSRVQILLEADFRS